MRRGPKVNHLDVHGESAGTRADVRHGKDDESARPQPGRFRGTRAFTRLRQQIR